MPAPQAPPGGPQGAPPSQPPGQDGSAPPDQGGGQAPGAISQLLMNVDKAIDHLSMLLSQSKAASPEDKQIIQAIDQLYGKLLQNLGMGDAQSEDSGPQGPGAQGQTVPPEAGGNKGAIPSPT